MSILLVKCPQLVSFEDTPIDTLKALKSETCITKLALRKRSPELVTRKTKTKSIQVKSK